MPRAGVSTQTSIFHQDVFVFLVDDLDAILKLMNEEAALQGANEDPDSHCPRPGANPALRFIGGELHTLVCHLNLARC